jgi:hypothetical protein
MNLQAYPLYWPDGWKRTHRADRRTGTFNKKETEYRPPVVPGGQGYNYVRTKNLTVSDGIGRILESLERMGISRNDVIISTNVRTRLDGLPRSGEKEPDDPGAAVYWRKGFNAPMRCMAIDRYSVVADNLGAIAATLEAMRAIERHGGAEVLDRSFQGFAALTDGSKKPWRQVLGIEIAQPSAADIENAFRALVKIHHPDIGGSTERFQEIAAARDAGLAEVRA